APEARDFGDSRAHAWSGALRDDCVAHQRCRSRVEAGPARPWPYGNPAQERGNQSGAHKDELLTGRPSRSKPTSVIGHVRPCAPGKRTSANISGDSGCVAATV